MATFTIATNAPYRRICLTSPVRTSHTPFNDTFRIMSGNALAQVETYVDGEVRSLGTEPHTSISIGGHRG